MHRDRYQSFEELAQSEIPGKDFNIRVQRILGCTVAVIAPHGGAIEFGTSEIAQQIAGSDFNMYLFEGIKPIDNYKFLHITSHKFNEPECLNLIAGCNTVVAIHGCRYETKDIFLGGLDHELKLLITDSLRTAGFQVSTEGHQFPAREKNNICNLGATRRGVQIEVCRELRRGESPSTVAWAVRRGIFLT